MKLRELLKLRPWLAYLRDPAVAAWRKGAGLAALLYVVWPLDLVPDVIPILGWLDDIGVLGAGVWYVTRQVRRHAEAQRAQSRKIGP